MAQPTRDEAVAILDGGHDAIRRLLARLSDEQIEAPATIGGGDWSAKDLVGHLATWEELAVRAIDQFRRGEVPSVERPDGVFAAPATGRLDEFNARTVEEKRAWPLAQVLRDADDVHTELVKEIRSMPDHEWRAKAFYDSPNDRRRRLSTLVGAILGAPGAPFRHAFAHVDDLEAYVSSVS